MSSGGKKVVLAAYHDMGTVGLECFLRHGWEIALVYTHEDPTDEPVWWRSVAELARENDIPVETADIASPEQIERLKSLEPDYLFSIYYRKLLPASVLSLFPQGAFNLHGSLLPKFRGRAPLNWAILEGEVESGVTLHHMVEKADAGDVVDQEWIPIDDEDSVREVHTKLLEASVNVWDRCLNWFERGKAPRLPQDHSQGFYRGRRTADDGRLDFAWSAKRCFDLVRAVTRPYPGAFGQAGERRFKIWWALPVDSLPSGRSAAPGAVLIESGVPHVACGEGFLRIETIEPPGASEMEGAAAARGGQLPEGLQFFASKS